MFKTFNGCAAETIVVVKADRRLRNDKADIFEDIDVNIRLVEPKPRSVWKEGLFRVISCGGSQRWYLRVFALLRVRTAVCGLQERLKSEHTKNCKVLLTHANRVSQNAI